MRATIAGIVVLAFATAVLIVRFPELRPSRGLRSLPLWFFTATLAAVLALQMTIVSQWPDFDRRYASPWVRGSPSSNLAALVAVVAFVAGILLEHLR